MEPDLAPELRIRGQRRKRAAEFQFVPTGLRILRDQPVPGNDLRQLLNLRAVYADESVEHGPCSQHIHCLRAPAAADLQPLHAFRQRDPQINLPQGDVPLVVFVFFFVQK